MNLKILYLDCSMGAAGDMLTAALLELLPDKEEFLKKINTLGIPGVEVKCERALRCGILGTHMNVTVNGVQEHIHNDNRGNHGHYHGEDNAAHEHYHASLDEIHRIIDSFDISSKVKANACEVYDLIADAESKVHGVSVGEVHFHEVGAMDAVADVVAVCMLINELAPDRIIASPVNTGFGSVRCAHGILPVPAPATASILKGIPVYAGQYEGEMCTPTGAALIRYFVNDFGQMPEMVIENIGYGMGTKEFPQANCIRAVSGYTDDSTSGGKMQEDNGDDCGKHINGLSEDNGGGHDNSITSLKDNIVELECNIDDMTGEELGYAAEVIRNKGALDVFILPIQMKKGRPGQMLVCLCKPEKADETAACILKHTTTFGVRRTDHTRYILDRQISIKETPFGSIRVKHGEGYGVSKSKPEYEDMVKAAGEKEVSIIDIRNGIN